jgi:hypothetical protein
MRFLGCNVAGGCVMLTFLYGFEVKSASLPTFRTTLRNITPLKLIIIDNYTYQLDEHFTR